MSAVENEKIHSVFRMDGCALPVLVGEGRDPEPPERMGQRGEQSTQSVSLAEVLFLGSASALARAECRGFFFCHLGLKNEVCASDRYNVHRVC